MIFDMSIVFRNFSFSDGMTVTEMPSKKFRLIQIMVWRGRAGILNMNF